MSRIPFSHGSVVVWLLVSLYPSLDILFVCIDCDIIIENDTSVSRRHAKIRVSDNTNVRMCVCGAGIGEGWEGGGGEGRELIGVRTAYRNRNLRE